MSKHQTCRECHRDFVGPDTNINENYCPECAKEVVCRAIESGLEDMIDLVKGLENE